MFNQAVRILTCKLWSHKTYGYCVSEDSTGIYLAGMPYDFVSPEIVVIYRLHAGGLHGFLVSTVCGSVWASNTRTEPIRSKLVSVQTGAIRVCTRLVRIPYGAFRGL